MAMDQADPLKTPQKSHEVAFETTTMGVEAYTRTMYTRVLIQKLYEVFGLT